MIDDCLLHRSSNSGGIRSLSGTLGVLGFTFTFVSLTELISDDVLLSLLRTPNCSSGGIWHQQMAPLVNINRKMEPRKRLKRFNVDEPKPKPSQFSLRPSCDRTKGRSSVWSVSTTQPLICEHHTATDL